MRLLPLRRLGALAAGLAMAGAAPSASAQLVQLSSFDPAAGALCGLGRAPSSGTLWVYPCEGSSVRAYSPAGAPLGAVGRPGEVADDVDVAFAPHAITLGGVAVPAGTLLFVNGETDGADVYAVDPSTGAVLASLATRFGVGHVVGGAYHPERGTFFFVQDRTPSSPTERNHMAEVDATTGAVVQRIDLGGVFRVFYSDLDVSPETGHLFVVSSDEPDMAEFRPDGTLVARHPLPAGVGLPSGLALDCARGEAWVSSASGAVFRLGGVPCRAAVGVAAGAAAPVRVASVSPNPTRGTASLVLRVARPQHARVTVLDALGRTVAVVHDGPLAEGEQTFTLSGALPAGLYVVRVATGDGVQTARFVRTD